MCVCVFLIQRGLRVGLSRVASAWRMKMKTRCRFRRWIVKRWNEVGPRQGRKTSAGGQGERQDRLSDLEITSPNKAWSSLGSFITFLIILVIVFGIYYYFIEQLSRANYKLRSGFSLLVLSRAVSRINPRVLRL